MHENEAISKDDHPNLPEKEKKPKCLVLGGAGYIGGHLTDLLGEDYEVTVYDNLLFEDRYLKSVNFIYGDIRDEKKMQAILPSFDVVIALAALVGDGACQVDPALTSEINFHSMKWLTDHYSGKIVFMSTCSVYGKNDDLLDEESPTSPLSVYASTKLQAEQYLLEKKPDSLVFRLGTLFGVGDQHSRLRLDLVANILSLKATRGETLSVFSGNQARPILHVRDVGNAILHCMENDISGLYNLSYRNVLIKELAEEIAKVIPGSKINYSEMPFEDQRNYRVSPSKIESTGWKPLYDLRFGIQQIHEIIRENRIRDVTDPVYSNATYVRKLYGKD